MKSDFLGVFSERSVADSTKVMTEPAGRMTDDSIVVLKTCDICLRRPRPKIATEVHLITRCALITSRNQGVVRSRNLEFSAIKKDAIKAGCAIDETMSALT